MSGTLGTLSVGILVVAAAAVWAHEQAGTQVLFDFETKKGRWLAVNDNVMGGVSEGGAQPTAEGVLDFSGNLSLENNGGFSSVRAVLEPGSLKGHEGIILRIRGDGRSYYINLHTERRTTPGSWRAPLLPEKNQWSEIRVPFRNFEWTLFGQRLPGRSIESRDVQSLGFTISDKKEGPFKLQVDWIRAYGAAEPEPDLMDRIESMEQADAFAQAVRASGLEPAFRGAGPMTIFAPTEAAFAELPRGNLAELLQTDNRTRLRGLLLNHVVPGQLTLGRDELQTLAGREVSVDSEGPFRIGDAEVVTANVLASNGILHLVDSVLQSPEHDLNTNEAAVRLIEHAVSVGAPLYNAGNSAACVAVYETTIDTLLGGTAPGLSETVRGSLKSAVEAAAREPDPLEAAWLLRRALDTARQAVK